MKDPTRQTRRQSLDLGEIWNVQTNMNISQEKWDKIFHNWDNPEDCSGAKKPIGCSICDQLYKLGFYIHPDTNKVYSTLVAVIYKNINLFKQLQDISSKISKIIFIPTTNYDQYLTFEDIQIPISIFYNPQTITIGKSIISYGINNNSDVDHYITVNNDKLYVETGTMLHENLYIINTLIKK
jgi:hypothetical protein